MSIAQDATPFRLPIYIVFNVQGEWGSGGPPRSAPERFVQFWLYPESGFHLDLPTPILAAGEAETILRDKPAFFLAKNDDPESHESQYNPVQRKYGYGEEELAAEDAAYILFDVWKLPPDVSLDVKAGRP